MSVALQEEPHDSRPFSRTHTSADDSLSVSLDTPLMSLPLPRLRRTDEARLTFPVSSYLPALERLSCPWRSRAGSARGRGPAADPSRLGGQTSPLSRGSAPVNFAPENGIGWVGMIGMSECGPASLAYLIYEVSDPGREGLGNRESE